MTRIKVKDIDDDSLTGLLNEIRYLSGFDFMDQPSMALGDYIDFCFDKFNLKKALPHLPTNGILTQKLGELKGRPVEEFFRGYCRLRGVIFEGYEARKAQHVLAACAPKGTRRLPAKRESRTTALIRQRRSNGDL